MAYDLESVDLPVLQGPALKLFVKLLETESVGDVMCKKLLADTGFANLRDRVLNEAPTLQPLHVSESPDPKRSSPKLHAVAPSPRQRLGWQPNTCADYTAAYREGRLSPEDVAQRVIKAIEDSNRGPTPLRAIIASRADDIRTQAKASSERYRRGEPLSPLDGVPVSVKDELDQRGYPTTVGTAFMGRSTAQRDATPVARLRSLGALLIGKVNMHEIGIGVTGFNAHHGVPQNPYKLGHYTGGSSSGSASSVAAGLCPLSVGADGGGSIRIPAGLCGINGLKATYGRISEHGAAPLCWSVAHVGPMGVTARDTALGYLAMAGPDPLDPLSCHQPDVTLDGFGESDLTGIKIGIYEPWFNHASDSMVRACRSRLDELVTHGAELVAIEIPDLDLVRLAHLVTIASEMRTAMDVHYPNKRSLFGLDVRTNLALASRFTSLDYVKAQRIRTESIKTMLDLFDRIDLIASPTTGCTSPAIPDSALPDGISDLGQITEIMRFAPLANLTGLPAISVPAGYDSSNLPIGLQFHARPWNEALLLKTAWIVESHHQRIAPEVSFNLLRS
ncbi:MAG: amidase [Myxococcota bacterium]|nr:amidase [Myxococcota bacterium]